MATSLVQLSRIDQTILRIRETRVILDTDLARLYGVSTKALNQAVKRNRKRFPADFVFQLSKTEKEEVVTNCDHLAQVKFSRTLPLAFTEHGTIMAASVLNSKRAVEISVYIVRAFVKLRAAQSNHQEMAKKLDQLELNIAEHDSQIDKLFKAIRRLIVPEIKPKRPIGFRPYG